MSRPAEQLLEFDRLKEIVSGFTTCAPGRRAILAVSPQQDVRALNAEFALISEAVAYLRPRLGSRFRLASRSGTMAREDWRFPLLCSRVAQLLDAATLMEIVSGGPPDIQRRYREISTAGGTSSIRWAIFVRQLTAIRRAVPAQRRNQRRRFEGSDLRRIRGEPGTDARPPAEVAGHNFASARRTSLGRTTSRCVTTVS